MLDISSCYDINQAAEALMITVPVLKMLIADGSAPAHVMHKGKTYFTGDAQRSFAETKTICKNGDVVPKVTARLFGFRQVGDHDRPILGCYPTFNYEGAPIWIFIDQFGVRQAFPREAGTDINTVYRAGVFHHEVSDPLLAGLSDGFLGNNALVPEYKHVRCIFW